MKLAQRQGEGSDGKWTATGATNGVELERADRGAEPLAPHVHPSIQAPAREDDPYRGKSDGEILQRFEM